MSSYIPTPTTLQFQFQIILTPSQPKIAIEAQYSIKKWDEHLGFSITDKAKSKYRDNSKSLREDIYNSTRPELPLVEEDEDE